MNKIWLLFCFFIVAQISAQDSIGRTSAYTEKDIRIEDSLLKRPKFESPLKDKYNGSEFQYEVKVEQTGVWERFKQWLSDLFESLFGMSNGVSSKAVDLFVNVLATLIVLYVVYLIAKLILNKEGQWIFGKSTTKKIIQHDDIERNLHQVDFEKLIASTLKSGDQRLVIRYYYLWLLRKMSEKNIIDWNPEKTNSDYFYEIQNESLRQDFTYVSYLYNYIWYGEFEITETHFESIKKTFETTLQSVK